MSVVHCKKGSYDVYIGRPSKWGNPFSIGKDGTREEVIEKYATWLNNNDNPLKKDIPELRGKTLGCWCAPKACHGDVLAKWANMKLSDFTHVELEPLWITKAAQSIMKLAKEDILKKE